MLRLLAFIALGIALPAAAKADRSVHFEADFESGRFMPAGRNVDSFWVMTLPDPQKNGEVIRTGSGGGDASSGWDSRVLQKASIGGQTVTPRNGQYFAVQSLHYNKDYRNLNGNGEEKSRVALAIVDEGNEIEFDTEAYMGFSIFVPENFEHETGSKGDLGSSTLVVINSDSSANMFTLRIYVPTDSNEAHWFLHYEINPYSVEATREREKQLDLGPVNADKGKWTDFVIRFRSNPFSKGTNPAKEGIPKAHDKYYEGNKGILQVWKAEGNPDSNGNRRMARKLSIVNSPVGNVPGTMQGKSKLHASLRIYKYNWQTMPTDVRGPITFGFDALRFGEVRRDGTGYSDVHPTGQACTDRCPSGNDAEDRPKPPELSFGD